jgi:hypothetical protein
VQTPWIDPGWATQGSPAQQSAFVVHDCPLAWQDVLPQTSCPFVPGTQGTPPQQSPAVEQALPVATQPMPASPPGPVYALHRGTPSGSRTQAVNFGVCGPQQSDRALDTPQA